MLKIWKYQISLFGVLLAAVCLEATIIPSVWSPLRVDFFIGMIIGQIIFIPFSQGFGFVIIGSLVLQAFSGARLGFIPLVYIVTYLAVEVLRNVIYLENAFTQALLGVIFYCLILAATVVLTEVSCLEGLALPLAAGALLTGASTPIMVSIVGRLQRAYELEYE